MISTKFTCKKIIEFSIIHLPPLMSCLKLNQQISNLKTSSKVAWKIFYLRVGRGLCPIRLIAEIGVLLYWVRIWIGTVFGGLCCLPAKRTEKKTGRMDEINGDLPNYSKRTWDLRCLLEKDFCCYICYIHTFQLQASV